MITFSMMCVALMIIFGLSIISLLIGSFVGLLNSDEDAMMFTAYIISVIGFGICLTIILYQNGLIY